MRKVHAQSALPSDNCRLQAQYSMNENAGPFREKVKDIVKCLENKNVDLWLLRTHALTKGGLVNSELRRRAWPKLVGVDASRTPISSRCGGKEFGFDSEDELDMLEERDEIDMIHRDKGRSILTRSSHSSDDEDGGSNRDQMGDASREEDLAWLIESVVLGKEKDKLYYYQGFHDVAAMFLVILKDRKLASKVLRRLAASHFREAMRIDFSNLMLFLRLTFFQLIEALDEEMHLFFRCAEVDPEIVLPWLITWFCHDVDSRDQACRLFDVFIASHPTMPLYMSVAFLLQPEHRTVILSSDCDPASVHMTLKHMLSVAFEDAQTTQNLVDDAINYMEQIPPVSLRSLAKQYESSISLFKDAPTWAHTSSIPSDWALGKIKRWHFRGKKDKQKTSNTATCKKKAETMYRRAKIAIGKTRSRMHMPRNKRSASLSYVANRTYEAIGVFSTYFIGVKLNTKRKRVQ